MAKDSYEYAHCKTCCWDPTGYCPVSTHFGCVIKNGQCQGSLEDISQDRSYPPSVRKKADSEMTKDTFISRGTTFCGDGEPWEIAKDHARGRS